MKYPFLIMLFLLGGTAIAQPYQSFFGETSTSWKIKDIYPSDTVTYYAYAAKDTVVNNKTYKKVFILNIPTVKTALLREDIITGTLWYRDVEIDPLGILDTNEYKITRMNLKVGDTFNLSRALPYQPNTYHDSVGIVDSINIINGLKHIYFKGIYKTFTYDEPYTFIESVGFNIGIFGMPVHPSSLYARPYLLCSYKDGVKTAFINKHYNGDCGAGVSIEQLEMDNGIALYPQPAIATVNIKNNSGAAIIQAIVVNSIGTVVLQHSAKSITSLHLDDIPTGYYFVKLYMDNGETITRKMVKQ